MTDLDGAVTINESSADADFRVESDSNTHAFYVDGGTSNVGIGESSPTGTALQIRRSGAAGIVLKETGVAQFYVEQDTDAKIRWTNSNDLIFSGGADGTTEKARILNGGGLTFNGDTAAANALNDYEEGSFTIGVTGATASLGNATAYYTKIGDLVYWFWYSASSTFSSASGTATLTGLPFTQDGQSSNYGTFQFVHGNGVDGSSTGGYITNNSTQANFIDAGGVGGASFNNGSSQYIMVSGIYKTDA